MSKPQKIFLVLAHPEPQSFNAAMHREAQETCVRLGHEIRVSDLYRLGFDPVSDRRNFISAKESDYYKQQVEEAHASQTDGFVPALEEEIRKVEWCDLMIWQFPLWWFGLPGILKGWVDKVFALRRAYDFGKFYRSGLFAPRRAMLSLTTGSPRQNFVRGGFNGDMEAILRPVQRGMLEFVGMQVLRPHVVYQPAHLSDGERREDLRSWSQRLATVFEEPAYAVGEY